MKRLPRLRALGAGMLLLFGFSVAGCNDDTTDIKKLLDDPSRYDKQVVRIKGTVEQGIGALGYGTYYVDDGTAKLWVLTKTGGAPRIGARVGVEGEFRSAYTLGEHSGAVLMESRRYDP